MNSNFYIITNLIGATAILVLLIISFFMEGKTFKKISLKHLTVIGMFGAASVVLTNMVGYTIPIMGNIRLAMGDWIIFLLGMMFGPLAGVISGITIDSIGSIIYNGWGYHCGYMMNKVFLGFCGALVFITKKNNLIWLKTIIFYSIAYIPQSLFLNQIWMMSWIGWAAWADVLPKLIKLPIVLPIYISITYATFNALKPLLDRWTYENVWCFRHIIRNDNLMSLD